MEGIVSSESCTISLTHSIVLVLSRKPLLLDPGHVEDVSLRQSLLDAVKLFLRSSKQ